MNSSSQYAVLLGSAVAIAFTGLDVNGAMAQTYPACQPPRSGEYLLMVLNPTEALQTQLRQVLPPASTTTVCNYLQDTVLRVDGFSDPEVANSWAQYATSHGGTQAFIARPVATPSSTAIAPSATGSTFPQPSLPAATPTAPTPTAPTPTASTPTIASAPAGTSIYSPQPLGTGYAVLVDYFNRTEAAAELQQILAHQIGLVAYAQRPYLLAVYTSDPAVANATLQSLSDRSFTALIVDSRRAILLTPAVAIR